MSQKSEVRSQKSILKRPARGMAVLLAALLLAASPLLAGYQFEFISRSDTVQQVEPGEVVEFHFTLTNTGTEPDVYEFDCRVLQGVPDWYVSYCVGFR